jgi:hypothetical protein
MSVKISALPAIVTPALTDVFPVVQAGVTYKETITQLGTLFGLNGTASSVLVTNGGGVASLSTTLPSGIAATSMALSAPVITNGIIDPYGQILLGLTSTGAGNVNRVDIFNAPTLSNPVVAAAGSDSNVSLIAQGKGTSGVLIKGVTDGSTGTAGFVGEVISSTVLYASPVSLTTATPTNLTSLSLTAGSWLVWGNVTFNSSNTSTNQIAWINSTSASIPGLESVTGTDGASIAAGVYGRTVSPTIVNFSTTTTMYLSAQSIFGAGTVVISGNFKAMRVR